MQFYTHRVKHIYNTTPPSTTTVWSSHQQAAWPEHGEDQFWKWGSAPCLKGHLCDAVLSIPHKHLILRNHRTPLPSLYRIQCIRFLCRTGNRYSKLRVEWLRWSIKWIHTRITNNLTKKPHAQWTHHSKITSNITLTGKKMLKTLKCFIFL